MKKSKVKKKKEFTLKREKKKANNWKLRFISVFM